MHGVIPSLRFAELPEAVSFYVDKLGFEVLRDTADQGNVALAYGSARVMLEAAGEFYSPEYNAAIAERLGGRSADALYLEAPELDAFYERLRTAGVTIVDPLAERPWGQSEFTVADHVGNWLTFWAAAAGS
jgi:uncharacterized glyoxalase superfamily protein PhnB